MNIATNQLYKYSDKDTDLDWSLISQWDVAGEKLAG